MATALRAVPRHRCSTGFRSGLSHCGAYPQLRSGWSRARPCACSREQSPLARAQGKAPRLLAGSLVWPEPEVHAPLAGPGGLWHNTSADIVHDASCGQILPSPRGATGRAMSNPTRHTPQGPSSQRPTRAAPPAEAQADGAMERSRPANVCSVRRSRGRPQPFWAHTSRAPAPGDARVQARRARRARCSPAAA